MLEILKFKAKEDISDELQVLLDFIIMREILKMVKLSYCPLAYEFSIDNDFFQHS